MTTLRNFEEAIELFRSTPVGWDSKNKENLIKIIRLMTDEIMRLQCMLKDAGLYDEGGTVIDPKSIPDEYKKVFGLDVADPRLDMAMKKLTEGAKDDYPF